MANRVNTRFVIALSAVLVVLTLGLAGTWYTLVHVRNSPERLVDRGQEMLDQGLVKEAIEQFGKAVHKQPNNVELLVKYAHAIQQVRTDEIREAESYLRHVVKALSEANTLDPSNPAHFNDLMQIYFTLGRDLGDFAAWGKMHEISQIRLTSKPDSVSARKYRGIAQVNRMERINLDPDQRSQAFEDLTAATQADPEDRDAFYHLTAWHVLEARALDLRSGDPEAIRQHRNQARELSTQSMNAHPGDFRRQIDRLRVLGHLDEEETNEAMDLVKTIEQNMLDNPPDDARLILEFTTLLTTLDRKVLEVTEDRSYRTSSGNHRAGAILDSAIKAYPNNPRLLAARARIYQTEVRVPEAIKLFKQVADSTAKASIFETLHLSLIKADASVQYAGLTLSTVTSMEPPDRENALNEIQALMDNLVSTRGESAGVNLVLGKLAIARRQWEKALVKIDKANSQFNDQHPEALLLSAKIRVQLGELGAAADRLKRLLQIRPGYIKARYELAEIHLRLAQLPEAGKHIDLILANDPTSNRALWLRGQYLSRTGKTQQAIELYESFDAKENPRVTLALARLYARNGDKDAARSMLEEQFLAEPSSLIILQDLIGLTEDADQARSYIALAREAGVSGQALTVVESQLTGSGKLADLVEDLVEPETDPLTKQLKRFRLYSRLRKSEQARQALDQAASIQADHPDVINARFDYALADRSWSDAQALVGRAAALNLDMAEGMFYRGQMELAQGKLAGAVASFRRGLTLRPVYSEGWRYLGDAQRRNGDSGEAITSYKQALDQRPDNVRALSGLAMVQDSLGQHEQALEQLRRAIQLRPNSESLRSQHLAYEEEYGNAEVALAQRRQIAKDNPEDYANRRALARLLAKLERADEAIETIKAVVEQSGPSRSNTVAASAVHMALGKTSEARDIVHDYVNSRGDDATEEDWSMLARFLMSIGQEDQALAAFRKAIVLEDPTVRAATREVADLLFNMRRADEAIEHYERLWTSHADEKAVGQRLTEALIRTNSLDRADEILDEVISRHGKDSNTLVLRALVARAGGNTPAALDALNKALELDPDRAVIFYQRADLLSTNPDQESKVLGDLNKALELNPELDSARALLATMLIQRGEREEAVHELQLLLARNPSNVSARLRLAQLYNATNQVVPLRTLLDDSARLFPRSPIWPRMQARLAYENGEDEAAIRLFRNALNIAPDEQSLSELVAALLELEQHHEAMEELRARTQLLNRSGLLQAFRGRALSALGETQPSFASFANAVALSRTFTQMTTVIGQMVRTMGREQAIGLLEPLAEGDEQGLVELSIAQLESELQQFDAALSRLKRIEDMIANNSENQVTFNRLIAIAYQQTGDVESSLAAYQQVLKALPNDLLTLNNTAYLLANDMGRPKEALSLAQRAALLAPSDSLVLDTLGWAMFQAGEHDQALRALRRSYELKPSAPNCFHLAEVLASESEHQEARSYLRQAKEFAEQEGNDEILEAVKKRLDN